MNQIYIPNLKFDQLFIVKKLYNYKISSAEIK